MRFAAASSAPRPVLACVDEHDLHKRRRVFEAVSGVDARVRRPGLKNGAHALGDGLGSTASVPLFGRAARSMRVTTTSFGPTLVRTSPRSMVSLSRRIASTDAAERWGLLVWSVVHKRGESTKVYSISFGGMGGSASGSAFVGIKKTVSELCKFVGLALVD